MRGDRLNSYTAHYKIFINYAIWNRPTVRQKNQWKTDPSTHMGIQHILYLVF